MSCQIRSNARVSSSDSVIKVEGCWLSDHSLGYIIDKSDTGKGIFTQTMSLSSFATFQRERVFSKEEGIACNCSYSKFKNENVSKRVYLCMLRQCLKKVPQVQRTEEEKKKTRRGGGGRSRGAGREARV